MSKDNASAACLTTKIVFSKKKRGSSHKKKKQTVFSWKNIKHKIVIMEYYNNINFVYFLLTSVSMDK